MFDTLRTATVCSLSGMGAVGAETSASQISSSSTTCTNEVIGVEFVGPTSSQVNSLPIQNWDISGTTENWNTIRTAQIVRTKEFGIVFDTLPENHHTTMNT